jgi:hypothetical protein
MDRFFRRAGPFFCQLFGSFSDPWVDMMTTQAVKTMDSSDAGLVAQSLAGSRDAFGRIVAR